ncbi:MAG: phospho-sugar mutase [Planctomycetaceae bacterium]|nr:phospho-sugar mutase [Planctomycetaceae bacterium]
MTNNASALEMLEAAAKTGKLSAAAAANIRTWLTQPYLREYAGEVAAHLAGEKWAELEEAFWTTVPFGTGGRRGRMYPIGCNAINDRTIGETAQGLADYVKEQAAADSKRKASEPLRCAVAYDTRHRSREFAELCSEIMAAAGFTVYFLNGYRSTPELSFAVRHNQCDCGIMITASHNPPRDNAAKVYGPSGGQFIPPHDSASIRRMEQVTFIRRAPFAGCLADGRVLYCEEEVDAAFIKAVLAQSLPGPRELRILYSPLHGVGASAVYPVLNEAGFREVEIFGPHATPNGDFPNVPKHVANPENPAVFDSIIERAKQTGAELILATDPDSDRLGCAQRRTLDGDAAWRTLTGNQLGALLTDYLLAARRAAGTLTPKHYVVKTLVTTELIRRIADRYGVETAGNLHVGFKWIGAEIDARGPEWFVFGAEESYGFLAGSHVRDKDAAVASLLTAELAARLKSEGKTLSQRLDELFLQYGCFTEGQINIQMPGEKGMEAMRALMDRMRKDPPSQLGGLRVVRVRDYASGRQETLPAAAGGVPASATPGSVQAPTPPSAGPAAEWLSEPLDAPKGDMVILDLESPGNYLAIRPSGTEPKVKIYLFAYDPPDAAVDLEATKDAQAERLRAIGDDMRAFSGA